MMETGGTRCPTLWLVLALLFLCVPFHAQEPPARENIRFLAVDIFVDAKDKPLAAYQLEFSATSGGVKIVGVEGGEHPAFAEAPFYDPKAMQQERVIIAAFSTNPADKLPGGKTRVATIHLQVSGTGASEFKVKLQVAADPNGKGLTAEASFEERNQK